MFEGGQAKAYGCWATMTTAIRRVRLGQLLNHLAHLADRQEVVGLDGGFTGHVSQGVFLPRVGMALSAVFGRGQIRQ